MQELRVQSQAVTSRLFSVCRGMWVGMRPCGSGVSGLRQELLARSGAARNELCPPKNHMLRGPNPEDMRMQLYLEIGPS